MNGKSVGQGYDKLAKYKQRCTYNTGQKTLRNKQSEQKSYVNRKSCYVDGMDINRASCFPSLDVDQ
jgi:hypothetical protein